MRKYKQCLVVLILMMNASVFANQAQHQFVTAADIMSRPDHSLMSLPRDSIPKDYEFNQSDMSVAEAAVFFQEVVFMTFHLSARQLTTEQQMITNYYSPEGWQQLNQASYHQFLRRLVQMNGSSAIVPLLPPKISAMNVLANGSFAYTLVMPVLLSLTDSLHRGRLERFMITATMTSVGHRQGIRGWKIQSWMVSPSKTTHIG